MIRPIVMNDVFILSKCYFAFRVVVENLLGRVSQCYVLLKSNFGTQEDFHILGNMVTKLCYHNSMYVFLYNNAVHWFSDVVIYCLFLKEYRQNVRANSFVYISKWCLFHWKVSMKTKRPCPGFPNRQRASWNEKSLDFQITLPVFCPKIQDCFVMRSQIFFCVC